VTSDGLPQQRLGGTEAGHDTPTLHGGEGGSVIMGAVTAAAGTQTTIRTDRERTSGG
jgi:hypothetical protein